MLTHYDRNQTSLNKLNDEFLIRYTSVVMRDSAVSITIYSATITSSESGFKFGGMVEEARAIPQANSNSTTLS